MYPVVNLIAPPTQTQPEGNFATLIYLLAGLARTTQWQPGPFCHRALLKKPFSVQVYYGQQLESRRVGGVSDSCLPFAPFLIHLHHVRSTSCPLDQDGRPVGLSLPHHMHIIQPTFIMDPSPLLQHFATTSLSTLLLCSSNKFLLLQANSLGIHITNTIVFSVTTRTAELQEPKPPG